MELATFYYSREAGWSVQRFPDLDSSRTMLLVFGASALLGLSAPILELSQAFPNAQMIGCSTSGEILGTKLFDGGLAASVVRFDHTRVRTASSRVRTAADSYAAGTAIAHALEAPDLRSILVLSDGLNVNGSELVRGISAHVPPSVVVTGGLAGDGDRFQHTWVLEDRVPSPGVVSAIGLYGDRVRVGHGSRGGWNIFGPERRITRSQGNILYEIDGRPALQLYKEYLGERASGLPATALLFPLSLRAHASDEHSLVRTVLGVDERSQSMRFAGDIPQGYLAQLMRANFDRLIDGASEAGIMARECCHDKTPMLTVAISCVGRRLVLGERTEEELEAIADVLPDTAAQIGFYSYGEISPYTNGRCDLHNQTMTLTTFAEV